MSEGDQRFDGRQGALAAGGFQTGERIGKLLQVGQAYVSQSFRDQFPEPIHIRPVGPAGMFRPAMQPEFD